MQTRIRALALTSMILVAGCSGGTANTNDVSSSVPIMGQMPPSAISVPTSGVKPNPSASPTATLSASPTVTPTMSSAPSPPSTTSLVLATNAPLKYIFKLQTDVIAPFVPTMEYSEAILFTYAVAIDDSAFSSGLQITPATAFHVDRPFVNQGGQTIRYSIPLNGSVGLRLRYVPGTSYHIVQPAFGVDITVKTPPVSIPAPVVMKVASPYYYGFLNHPWGFSGFLGGLFYATPRFTTRTASEQAALDAALATVQEIAQSGAGYVRLDFCADQTIGHLAPYATPHWATYDAILNALAAINVTVLPEIQQHCAPSYMHYNPLGGESQTMDNPTDYATWATAVATHLVGFPKVTRVELFNEPNLNGGWEPGTPTFASTQGDGAAPFMRAAYGAIKVANPNLMVVSGALAAGGHHVDPRAWITGAYNAGCKLGVCWDEISQHNYRWNAPASATILNYKYDNRFDIYKDVQNIAVAHGDPVPKMMLTEWGYSTCPDPVVCFDPAVQALYLAQGLNLALADPTIDGVTYVNVYNGGLDFWANTALVNNDRSLKPSFSVFQQFATGSH